jgi:hypothetical protein
MAPAELARALRRLNDSAVVDRYVVMPIEERGQTQRAVTAPAAYSDVLAPLPR